MLNKLGYWAVYGACWLVGLLPHWILYYLVAEAIYFILYRIVRYRLRVVRENLANSFPEKNARELRRIERGFYHNLAEYFIDAVDLASITSKGMLRRAVWPQENRDEVNRLTNNQNWIALMAHYGSWELMSAFGLYPDAPTMASAYRPLHSKVFDRYYYRIRNRLPKLNSVAMNEILRFYVAHRDGLDGYPISLVLVSDQNAPIDAQSEWVKFLNHPTVFFHGGEKIARKFSIPVFYMHVRKTGRGRWEQTFELIWDGISPTADHEITRRYAQLLEEEIRRVPELWLWSHRRWKQRIKGEAAKQYNKKYGTDY